MEENLADALLVLLSQKAPMDSDEIARHLNVSHQQIVGVIKSIEAMDRLIKTEQHSRKQWELTEEGKEIIKNGSHEAVLWQHVPNDGIIMDDLMRTVPNAKVGFNKAMSLGWIRLDKTGPKPLVLRKVETIDDAVQDCLNKINSLNFDDVSDQNKSDLKKRKLINEIVVKTFRVFRDEKFTTSLEKEETDLTVNLLTDNLWQEKKFKPYNFKAFGVAPVRGYLHPLMKVRSEFRQIFLEMGFTEMPTQRYVESSFWNFDALFQPQQHPARDEQDTFFISKPMYTKDLPSEYVKRVEKVHSVGDYGSSGYGYKWKIEEAAKNVLRTHTTASSIRMLYEIAKKPFKPVRCFSIDRVFRNESLDATHLAEFHQVEGLIAGENLSLGHLIGILQEFYKKLGIERLRFKPAYNPYTEPSMEIFSYHSSLKKWVEIGNSGMFRPEVLLPLGLDENVTVIAWGLSLERQYGIDNIRDLIGPRVDLTMIQSSPILKMEIGLKGLTLISTEQGCTGVPFARALAKKALLEKSYCKILVVTNLPDSVSVWQKIAPDSHEIIQDSIIVEENFPNAQYQEAVFNLLKKKSKDVDRRSYLIFFENFSSPVLLMGTGVAVRFVHKLSSEHPCLVVGCGSETTVDHNLASIAGTFYTLRLSCCGNFAIVVKFKSPPGRNQWKFKITEQFDLDDVQLYDEKQQNEPDNLSLVDSNRLEVPASLERLVGFRLSLTEQEMADKRSLTLPYERSGESKQSQARIIYYAEKDDDIDEDDPDSDLNI
ncbi:Phenylalanine--tRNA ligase alpha subunit B [Trichinella pseudospiralis]|uniref:Phenylalanine--tRNA ligase alpha subunit n=1 Tax=Trichinella pseudospiralis TaxID=6337 RepID=A0A0V0XNE9_TRIPS|nr:Phenylalanine--tRNA ligase alpha subunit B [Trichinella pseudospiralis]